MYRILLALGLAAVAVAAPAHAAVIGPGPDPRPSYGEPPRPTGSAATTPATSPEWLTLSYLAEAGFAGAVKLSCDPVGGGHPHAAAACATLTDVDADPGKIKAESRLCVLLYQPVTATLSGTWHGREVEWTRRFGNTCEMRRATGVLFQF
ncbi:SSI family serine proteinase inhibitor [Actinoplanes solisilvae]|uniref:SSI family serine proteinase inhibitor n=1 Tax=Actinoplanes solisilvae TaxID=2486853 RepID=UPI000FDA71CB|nr:SSI family serine proteinase inhibitor [Actinoplanes solisilvae]